MNKLLTIALLFSIIVNTAVVATLVSVVKGMHNLRQQPAVQTEELRVQHAPAWQQSELETVVISKVDSLQHDYTQHLIVLKSAIDQNREKMIPVLLENKIDTQRIENILLDISEKQLKAEELTINHIIELKDELDKKEWVRIVKKLNPDASHKRIVIREHPDGQINIDTEVKELIQTLPESLKDIDIKQLHLRRD